MVRGGVGVARRGVRRVGDRDGAALGAPVHCLKGNADILGAHAKEAAYADDDDLRVSIMVEEHVGDLADLLLVRSHDAHADKLRCAPLVNCLFLHEIIAGRLGRGRLRQQGRRDERRAYQTSIAEILQHISLHLSAGEFSALAELTWLCGCGSECGDSGVRRGQAHPLTSVGPR